MSIANECRTFASAVISPGSPGTTDSVCGGGVNSGLATCGR